MKKFLFSLLAAVMMLGSPALAQTNVSQGGTGINSIPSNYVLIGNNALHAQAVSTSTFSSLLNFLGQARAALSSSATGLSYNSSTGIFTLTSGYNIPLTASTTNWNGFYDTPNTRITAGTNMSWAGNTLNGIADATVRGLFTNTATGLTYNNSTGATSLTAGYNIPLTASTTNWNSFYDTPSTRITAGANCVWTGNSINCTSAGGATTTINGVNGPTFTFATSTTGADINYSTTTGTVTLNVPTASASNRGALSNTDWSTFNNKAPTASPTFTGNATIANASTSADTIGTLYSTTVAYIRGLLGDSTNATGTNGMVLRSTGTSTLWTATSSLGLENPLTFSTGLTRTTNTVTVNTSQNIATLSNLASNGLVTTSGSNGTLGVTVPGTGILTALGVNVGSAGSVVVNGGALGTPSSGTLTNATGLPVAGLSNLGTGVGTWLITPSSANLLSALTTKTGTGNVVFDTSPTLVTPILGVASSTAITVPTLYSTTQAYLKALVSDSVNATGTAGQVLSSTGTSTLWITPASGGISNAYASSSFVDVISNQTAAGNKTFTGNTTLGNASTTAVTIPTLYSTTVAYIRGLFGDSTNATGTLNSVLSSTGTSTLWIASTGSGSNVLATSPVLVTPNLGTPSAVTLTNGTGLPIAGLTGLGTGVGTALGVNVGSAGAFVTFNGALGTPSSGTLTNATGLPVAGLSNLGTGVGTWLITPSSANLLSALTTKTGTGNVVFDTSPTLVTPILGVASSTAISVSGNFWVTGTSTLATTTISRFTVTGQSTLATASTTGLTVSGDLFVTGTSTHATSTITKLTVSGQTTLATASSTGFTVSGDLFVTGTSTHATSTISALRLTGPFRDSINATGTSGQVLQSTGTSTLWATAAAGGTAPNFTGNGSDGPVTTVGTVTLTRDMYYTTLTVATGTTVNTNGYKIFATVSVTVAGVVQANGGTGGNGGVPTAGTAGAAAYTAGSLPASIAGNAGGTGCSGGGACNGPGGASANINGSIGVNGQPGGAGGNINCCGNTGSPSGTSVATAINKPITYTFATSLLSGSVVSLGELYMRSSAGGGGGGGGSANNPGTSGGGGGGGASGGMIVIYSASVTVQAGGTIQANGGNGGDGGTGSGTESSGGGTGAGGSGGVILIVASTYTNSGTVQCLGGTRGANVGGHGSDGTNGVLGTNGISGNIYTFAP